MLAIPYYELIKYIVNLQLEVYNTGIPWNVVTGVSPAWALSFFFFFSSSGFFFYFPTTDCGISNKMPDQIPQHNLWIPRIPCLSPVLVLFSNMGPLYKQKRILALIKLRWFSNMLNHEHPWLTMFITKCY